jgi:enoyl-[acyl-carrier protein] reductase/trans-2-enoyl-CoA reductase (NAD+)
VLKAVVTQASAAIPVMPLYLGLLFKVMKQDGSHEGCIEQLDLLFRESLYGDSPRLDEEGRLRADYMELRPEIQDQVSDLWSKITDENLNDVSDMAGYKEEFLKLFGFGIDTVDYDADVATVVPINNLLSL